MYIYSLIHLSSRSFLGMNSGAAELVIAGWPHFIRLESKR